MNTDFSNIKQFVDSVTSDLSHFEENPYCTYEFSTSEEYLQDKLLYISKINLDILNKGLGVTFVIFHCETCKGHNENKPYHVMLIKSDSKELKELSKKHYTLEQLFYKNQDHNNAPVNINTISDMISFIEQSDPNFQKLPLYLELTMIYDSHKKTISSLS